MDFIIWLIVGGVSGWIAGRVVGKNTRQDLLHSMIVGVLGAFLGGVVLTPVFSIGAIDEHNFTFPAVLVSLIDALLLLGTVSSFRTLVSKDSTFAV